MSSDWMEYDKFLPYYSFLLVRNCSAVDENVVDVKIKKIKLTSITMITWQIIKLISPYANWLISNYQNLATVSLNQMKNQQYN